MLSSRFDPLHQPLRARVPAAYQMLNVCLLITHQTLHFCCCCLFHYVPALNEPRRRSLGGAAESFFVFSLSEEIKLNFSGGRKKQKKQKQLEICTA